MYQLCTLFPKEVMIVLAEQASKFRNIYIEFHCCVANDLGCPECRQTVLTPEFQDSVSPWRWVDEWVRRRNGNAFETLRVNAEEKYVIKNARMKLLNKGEDRAFVNYVLLECKANPNKWCPDNVVYSMTFLEYLPENKVVDLVWSKLCEKGAKRMRCIKRIFDQSGISLYDTFRDGLADVNWR